MKCSEIASPPFPYSMSKGAQVTKRVLLIYFIFFSYRESGGGDYLSQNFLFAFCKKNFFCWNQILNKDSKKKRKHVISMLYIVFTRCESQFFPGLNPDYKPCPNSLLNLLQTLFVIFLFYLLITWTVMKNDKINSLLEGDSKYKSKNHRPLWKRKKSVSGGKVSWMISDVNDSLN